MATVRWHLSVVDNLGHKFFVKKYRTLGAAESKRDDILTDGKVVIQPDAGNPVDRTILTNGMARIEIERVPRQ